MSKLLKGSIDLTKIKKEHIFNGKKGKYINVDIWINDKKDDYENDGAIKQSWKEGEDFKSDYIGNVKKGFGWGDSGDIQEAEVIPDKPKQEPEQDDLPF